MLNTMHEDISETFTDQHGQTFRFVRQAYRDHDGSVPLSQLADDEVVIYPGLIYRRVVR